MGNNNQSRNKSRRWFLTGGLRDAEKEKVKMLTADGKMIEVDKAVIDTAAKKKVSNMEILQWMKNPSKNES